MKLQQDHSTTKGLVIGIDAGSVSLNGVVIDPDGRIVYEAPYERHYGRVVACLQALLSRLYDQWGAAGISTVALTGSYGKPLSARIGLPYEFETISQVLGVLHVVPQARTIISMGGQDTALLQIGHTEQGWELESFTTNGPCASGTGSFIDQQAERLAASIYERRADGGRGSIDQVLKDFIALGLKSHDPADVACRCTVFTKSDMIHLQNKGARLEDIIYGLHVGNARNYTSTMVCNRVLADPIVFIGGLSLNPLQVKAFQTYFPGLVVPPRSTSLGALGVALQARAAGEGRLPDLAAFGGPGLREDVPGGSGSRLVLRQTVFNPSMGVKQHLAVPGTRVFLGIDIGSTTTKYALVDAYDTIVHKDYVMTQGKPIEVTQRLLEGIQRDLGDIIVIDGVATTGSGRHVVGDFLNADLIIDEITAHATGAVAIDPSVDTIFEIGGQDSKYIAIANTHPLDFDMNKVCAAGTGSFLHELANKYGINIVGEFEEIALAAQAPVKLAERCTVFMESDLVSYLQKGMDRNDLIAGLCYAIVHNYLNRVVGRRRVGQRVMFLGGPSLNRGVVAAFENVLGRGLIVPQHREVLGAYGAALSVKEQFRRQEQRASSFRGLASAIADGLEYTEKTCRADSNCHNQCKLKIYNFGGRRSVWGGECGRYEVARASAKPTTNYFERRHQIWQTHMQGLYEVLGEAPLMESEGRPTVGMQRALYGHNTAVLWSAFFDRLGFRLVMTPPTTPLLSQMGIEAMTAETCYPVKVAHGHAKALAGMTRYLFLPTLVNMPTPKGAEAGAYCPMVQSNGYMARVALLLDEKALLTPVVHLKEDADVLAWELTRQIGKRLGVSHRAVQQAVVYGLARQKAYEAELQSEGRAVLEKLDQGSPTVIVTGRPYNLYDDRLNLRLGQQLVKIGITALPMDLIDVDAVDLSDFSSMYWGLGARILRTAKYIRAQRSFFGLHLTNFGCGADSFIEHFYRHIMGPKPYLILELDEHSAVAGVMTRLEAYRHVILNCLSDAEAAGRERLTAAN